MKAKLATVAKGSGIVGISAGTGYAALSSPTPWIAIAVVVLIVVVTVAVVVLASALSKEKTRREAAHTTLREILGFALRMAGREAPGPSQPATPPTPIRVVDSAAS